jgi:hypothetical protein
MTIEKIMVRKNLGFYKGISLYAPAAFVKLDAGSIEYA